MGKLLCEKILRDVWCRNESVQAEIGQILQTHASPLVVGPIDISDIVKDKLATHSLNGFAMYVKLNLLQTYNDACTITNCYICSLQN